MSRWQWRIGSRHAYHPLVAVLLVAGLALLLSACGDSSSVASSGGSSGASGTPIPGVTVVVGQNSTTPTLNVVGGQGAQEGIADVCTQPPQVNASVPSSIPAYPGAKLRLSDLENGNGDFGFCTTASTSDIAAFYIKQLPGKGWQSVTSYNFSTGKQVTATQGSAYLIVTMQADAHTSGETDILITVSGM